MYRFQVGVKTSVIVSLMYEVSRKVRSFNSVAFGKVFKEPFVKPSPSLADIKALAITTRYPIYAGLLFHRNIRFVTQHIKQFPISSIGYLYIAVLKGSGQDLRYNASIHCHSAFFVTERAGTPFRHLFENIFHYATEKLFEFRFAPPRYCSILAVPRDFSYTKICSAAMKTNDYQYIEPV